MSKSIYPSIPSPGSTLASMQPCLSALRQAVSMIIINAQNPSPNFAASSAAQVFITRDDIKGLGIVGPPGPAGATGPAGASGVPEAPNDVNTYGRHALAWSVIPPALPLAGGTMTGVITLPAVPFNFATLPVNALNDAAAATAGIAVGGLYRNGSQLMIRVV